MPIEMLNLFTQGALAAIFAYLYWDAKKYAQEQAAKYDREIAALYNQRVNDLKWLAKIPTDLEGNYKVGPDSTVRA